MRVELLRPVEPDLDVIMRYIARHNEIRALSFVEELREEFRLIANKPEGYRLREEYGHDVRLAPFGEYVIIFRIKGNVVQIRRVVHGRRNLSKLLTKGK